MGISKANATWTGGLKGGNGVMRPEHAGEAKFSLGSRFEGQPQSNPEELIGAALSGCFSMALAANLEKGGHAPTRIDTRAEVKLDKVGEGFGITGIALTTEVSVEGLDNEAFQKVAEETKKGCPVSKALGAVPITLTATLAAK